MFHSFRNHCCLCVVLSVAALLAACGNLPPRIVVEPRSQDLGQVSQQVIDLTYTVRNSGGSPLRIEKVSASCDCTKATVERQQIAPGESTPLRVVLNPMEDNLYGDIMRVIYIRSNDPTAPEVEVEFRVNLLKAQ